MLYIRTFFYYSFLYGFRHRHHPTFVSWFPPLFFLSWFPSWQETIMYIFFVSFYGFRRWSYFCLNMVSVVAGKHLFYGFRRWTCGRFCRCRRIQHFRTYRAIPRLFVCVFMTGFRRCFCCSLFTVSVVAGTHYFMVSVVGCSFLLLMVSAVTRNVLFVGFRR